MDMHATIMELKLKDDTLRHLKGALEVLSDLSSKAVFSSKGLKLQAFDARCVPLVAFVLPAEVFEKYYCERDMSVEWDVVEMAKVFRCTDDNDSVTIKAVNSVITFTLDSPDDPGLMYYISSDFKFGRAPIEIPESEYQAIFSMTSAKLTLICKWLRNLAGDNDATIVVDKDKERVYFQTLAKMGTSKIGFKSGALTLIGLKENLTMAFDPKFLNIFSKAPTLPHNFVTISISTKLGMVFEYKITPNGYIRYYMASKEDQMQT